LDNWKGFHPGQLKLRSERRTIIGKLRRTEQIGIMGRGRGEVGAIEGE